MTSDIVTIFLYSLFIILILFIFAIIYILYIIATWEDKVFKKETKKIIKNANIWSEKPVYVERIPCKTEREYRLSNADKYLSKFFLTDNGEMFFRDAYNRNEDLKDYLYDFKHLSKNGVSKDIYEKCRNDVIKAIEYKAAFVIIYEYKKQTYENAFSYKNIVQIRNRAFKHIQKQQIATETDAYEDYY